MYVPSHFKEDDIGKLQQYIRDYGFGLLIVADDGGIEVNHVPFHLSSEEDGTLGQLQCHLARSNPVWQRLQHGARVLAVFQGPDAAGPQTARSRHRLHYRYGRIHPDQ